jgi:hypothetical protein
LHDRRPHKIRCFVADTNSFPQTTHVRVFASRRRRSLYTATRSGFSRFQVDELARGGWQVMQ